MTLARTEIDWTDLEAVAAALGGNWQHFDSFCWLGRPDDADDHPDNWALIYTHNRDSGLLDVSNADAIAKALARFPRTAIPQSHNHWACGHVDGYALKVRDRHGKPTKALAAYAQLMAELADYPVLNEEDYSRREYDATLENIRDVFSALDRRDVYHADLIDDPDPASTLFSWFWDNDQSAVESRDDHGGYPSDAAMEAAVRDLWPHAMDDFDPDAGPDCPRCRGDSRRTEVMGAFTWYTCEACGAVFHSECI